ncbi:hypothetical protein ACFFX0_03505 [Citricoccus parietis]|uniref:Uncharacterized protein n=1 Tax=Citricoccus parietis TaxID=592307 RepID=A0ABV5FUD6_9MICC
MTGKTSHRDFQREMTLVHVRWERPIGIFPGVFWPVRSVPARSHQNPLPDGR